MKTQHSRFIPFYVSIAIVVGVLMGSFYTRRFTGGPVNFINTSSNKVNDLLHLIDEQYVDTVNMNNLVEKALPQILKELDPHSVYISAKDVAESEQDLKGSFSGIGVQFTIYADTVRVVRVVEGGPSATVGLRAGDRIVRIDGKSYVGNKINNEETMRRLKGEKNSRVSLGIRREGEKKELTFTITRGDIPIKSVDAYFMLNKEAGYLRITSWGQNTYAEAISALTALSSQGMHSLVLDLRGNPGGYLEAAVQLCNEFLPKDAKIVYAEGRRMPRENYTSNGRGAYQHLPLIILIDETSASASEIFAGAMQDNDRATLIGRRSFGKGLVQVPIQFRDGSVLRLTQARYYTPSGRCVQKPFKPGDEDAYAADLIERGNSGEYFHPDSIKTSGEKYRTRLGRIVYGGGGIIPDHFIPRDTLGITSYFRDIYLRGTMYRFAYHYADQHRKQLQQFSDPQSLAKHLSQQNLVESFTTYASKDGIRRRNLMIRTSKQLILQHLTSYIINDLLDQAASLRYSSTTDEAILKAIAIIEQKACYPKAPQKNQQRTPAPASTKLSSISRQ